MPVTTPASLLVASAEQLKEQLNGDPGGGGDSGPGSCSDPGGPAGPGGGARARKLQAVLGADPAAARAA